MKTLFDVIEGTSASLVDDYERRAVGEIITSNIPTGIISLDDLGIGEKGILTIIQAHAGEGKSTWARLLLKGAVEYGHEALFYPFEDPEYQIGVSLISGLMNVSGWDLKRGAVEGNVLERINAATEKSRWAEKVKMETEKVPYKDLIRQMDDEFKSNPRCRFAVVDYLQAFDAEDDEKSTERVISRLTWSLAELAKEYNATIYAFSQVKKEVRDRGKAIFDRYVANAQFKGTELKPSEHLVIGFKPLQGDGQWSSSLYHYAKDIRTWWRPGRWLHTMGFKDIRDNYGLLETLKANFMPPDLDRVKLGWSSQGITEWRGKQ